MMARWLLSLTLLSNLYWLAGCQPAVQQQALQQRGLVYCAEGNPESFNPQLGTSGTTVDATSAQLYDRLIDYDAERQQFVPALATHWQILDDGLRYRFYLRPSVQFHRTPWFTPTRPFNAADVLFSFNRWRQSEHPFHQLNGGQYPFFTASGLRTLITAIEQPASDIVDFVLAQPDSSFLANLASDFSIILSAEYAQQLLLRGQPELLDRQPIGTGPYQFVSFRKDIQIRYQRHPQYWRTAPALEHLVFVITPSAHKRMLKLLTGECDIIPFPLVEELQRLAVEEDITVTSTVSANIGYWAFNTQHPPFDQLAVRQALSHAISRQTLIASIYGEHARQATGILPETSWAFTPVDQTYHYDPARAKALLAEAGYGDGFSMQIWALPVQRAYNPNAQRMAELMQADLAAIGVQAEIVSYEWNEFRRRLDDNQHDSVLIGWVADNADPDNFFRPTLSCGAQQAGSNRANWCDPVFDALLNEALREVSNERRREHYQALETYALGQAPIMPIANSVRFYASRRNVIGVELPPYGGINFRHARRVETQP